MDARWIVAIVVASVLVAALIGWVAWRVTRRGARAAKRVVDRRVDAGGLSLGGTLPPLVLEPLQAITSWADTIRPQLLPALAADGTITLVFSDIEGSTDLNLELGDERFSRLLAAHERLAKRSAREHGGRLVKSQGDGLMLAFKRAGDAVAFAVAFQRGVAAHDGDVELRVRMGVHTGEATTRQGDFFGANVALAARVCGVADGGTILITEQVLERLDDPAPHPVGRGRRQRLRGIPGRHRLLPVDWRQ